MDMSVGIRTLCRTPTNHYYDKPLPPLPSYGIFDIETELVPKPLFSRLTVLPPTRAAYAVVEPPSPIYLPSVSASISRTPSLRSSRHSISSSISSGSTRLSSAPNSPSAQRRSLALTYSSPSTVWYNPIPTPEPQTRRPLRRKIMTYDYWLRKPQEMVLTSGTDILALVFGFFRHNAHSRVICLFLIMGSKDKPDFLFC
ncbi:hypothetical protein EJ07DRAFT_153937 [Lizonia empirigonia]|nr:hypothetical protein EJ07DRAFT_153937 [Lizonia empirigonia]